MASYKYDRYVSKNDSAEFDRVHEPGTPALYAGIFRCEGCSHEIGIAAAHTLPPQTHAQHPANVRIRWRLVVFAVHNN